MPALYVHVPFCERKCVYCDFYSIEALDLHTLYVDACVAEIHHRADALAAAADAARDGAAAPCDKADAARDGAAAPCDKADAARDGAAVFGSVFFGGGTPSLLTAAEIGRILAALRERFVLADDAEITMECNPGTVTRESMRAYRALGVNRLSFGVQSFHDDELRFLTRIHTADDAVRAVADARVAGFDNVNVDLMFSLPGQTAARWHDNLARARDLGTTHLSCYSLTVERGTPLAAMHDRGAVAMPGDESDAALYELTMETLGAWGFRQYEVSNHALPGSECRHNLAYWRHDDYLGFGPSAHGTWRGRRTWNVRSLGGWLERVHAGIAPAVGGEDITPAMDREEHIYLGIRSEGVDLAAFRTRFGTDLVVDNAAFIARCIAEGLMLRDGGVLRLTRKGFVLCDEICAELS